MSSIQSPQPSFSGRTSPAIVFLIVIVAIVFIFCGLLHLLVKFILKNKPRSLGSQSIINYPEMSDSDTFQRQLQQLFELHDSGLDQAQIDALPVFHYKEINGLKEPFDCAVCLCEFSELDKLRLVPHCSHAFHVDCIDTWLLSNSTCPLCRRPLVPPNAVELEGPMEEVESNTSEVEFVGQDRVVFPIRLGKFRSTDSEKGDVGFASSSNLGARRCYSMGSYQYVVDESVLQVALSSKRSANGGGDVVVVKGRCSVDGDEEGKRISVASKNESFSVSKIWLWPKKGKFLGDTSSVDMALPWNTIV